LKSQAYSKLIKFGSTNIITSACNDILLSIYCCWLKIKDWTGRNLLYIHWRLATILWVRLTCYKQCVKWNYCPLRRNING